MTARARPPRLPIFVSSVRRERRAGTVVALALVALLVVLTVLALTAPGIR